MINNERELLDVTTHLGFTYLGRCEKLPDRRPNGDKLVNGDVFILDTKEKRGKDTITISNEYVYTDNGWVELSDTPQPNYEIPDETETFINELRDTTCKSSGVPVEMVKTRYSDFTFRIYDKIEAGYENEMLSNKIIDELCKVDGID